MNKNLVQGFLPSLICLLLLTPLAGKHLLHNISAVFGEEARNQVRSPNSAELKVLEYIEAANSGEKIYTPWWAYVAQLEYLSSRPAMFTGWDLMEKYSPGQ